MLFAIDIGNTNIEFGVFDEQGLKANFRLVTKRDITSDEVGLFTRQFFLIHNISIDMIEDVLITSVVPQVMYSVKNSVRKYINREPLVVCENLPVNIENKYKNKAEVGADRLVNAVAGYGKYGGDIIIIDFGTATTFDVLDENGAYLGGLIYPGIKISLDALVEKTAKLPKVEIEAPDKVIGENTIMSMQSGIIHGYRGTVINIIKEIEKERGCKLKIIVTGGLAKSIVKNSGLDFIIDKSLTLDGLKMIYDDYKKSL